MANNIVLKTYKGGNVTPQDDAIIYQTVISTNGILTLVWEYSKGKKKKAGNSLVASDIF